MCLVCCMAERSIVKEKSFEFGLAIIEVYKLFKAKNEYVVSRQLLKSGTAIGANISEALAAESTRDFLHKMSIASKEAREAYFWLELLQNSQLIRYDFAKELGMCVELIRMLTSIVKTTSTNRARVTKN